MNGSFQPAYVTDPAALAQAAPWGSCCAPSTFYLSDASAQQLAQLLGGTVVQKQPFPTTTGWHMPLANFIHLPSGQTVNAADLAYYARCGYVGAGQLAADLTQEINQGGAISSYYDALQAFYNAQGPMPEAPMFQPGDIGPAIQGMSYPDGTLDASGNVINPAFASAVES
jgi:hypothetical protein